MFKKRMKYGLLCYGLFFAMYFCYLWMHDINVWLAKDVDIYVWFFVIFCFFLFSLFVCFLVGHLLISFFVFFEGNKNNHWWIHILIVGFSFAFLNIVFATSLGGEVLYELSSPITMFSALAGSITYMILLINERTVAISKLHR